MEGSVMITLCSFALLLTAATDGYRIVFPVSVTLEEGDACTMHSGVPARCTDIRDCDYTKLNLRQNQPVICGFNGIFPVVCCSAVQKQKSNKKASVQAAASPLPSAAPRTNKKYTAVHAGKKQHENVDE